MSKEEVNLVMQYHVKRQRAVTVTIVSKPQ